jgi:hypothetical protein
MLNTLLVTLVAFTLLFFHLLMARIRLERIREGYGEMRALLEE